jgi:hypothetical protein
MAELANAADPADLMPHSQLQIHCTVKTAWMPEAPLSSHRSADRERPRRCQERHRSRDLSSFALDAAYLPTPPLKSSSTTTRSCLERDHGLACRSARWAICFHFHAQARVMAQHHQGLHQAGALGARHIRVSKHELRTPDRLHQPLISQSSPPGTTKSMTQPDLYRCSI